MRTFRAGVAGVYNHAEYSAEKHTAMDAWARYLDTVITGKAEENVVRMEKIAK